MATIKAFLRRYPSSTLILILFFCLSLFFISFAFLDLDTIKSLVREDEAIENMQAILFLLGAGLWGFALFATLTLKGSEKRICIFYMLWMGIFLFFFLEEISWGQRLFGFSTPEALKEVNMQDETTLHNIGIQNSLLWIHLLMGLFLAWVGIILPYLKLGSKRAAMLFKRFRFPILHHDLVACFGIILVIYSAPGFHWFMLVILVAICSPVIILLSGKFSHFFGKLKYPLFQFSSVMVIGSLIIAININLETAQHLSYNIAFEVRELFIAMALFFFSAFEAHGAWKRRTALQFQDFPSQITASGHDS